MAQMQSFRQKIKSSAQTLTQNKNLPALIVASIGRSGSTLVYNAAVNAFNTSNPLRRYVASKWLTADWSWNLIDKPLIASTVYKTHDYPENIEHVNNVKAIFIFGSLADAARSVYDSQQRFGVNWIKLHFEHLKSQGDLTQIFEKDVLKFENQIYSWATEDRFQVLCVRYESLWDNAGKISEFINAPIFLPKKRARAKTSLMQIHNQKIETFYGPIDERLAALPDVFYGAKMMRSYFKQS